MTELSTPTVDLAALKARQQATWASGDYAVVGTTLQIVAERLCETIDLHAASKVLDVAAGNGNATLAAACRFCEVTSTDYVPALIERGRARAAAEGQDIAFEVADAEALPFADASFDVVLSSMALHNIYNASERQTAVREIARVLAPGGRVLIVDVRHTSAYAATLRDAGLTDARCVQGVFSYLLTLITFGSAGWGYVIGSRVIGGKS